MDEIPVSAILAICARPELLDLSGPSALGPLGVASGMVSAAITRASYTARLRWFESLEWNCVSRLLRGFPPAAPSAKVLHEQSPPGLLPAVNEKAFDVQLGNAPTPPDDQPRAWGANPFARVPASGGQVSEAAPQQPGFRMPELVKKDKPTSGGIAVGSFGL